MFKKLFAYRFELLIVSQILILFGSLFVPTQWYANYFNPLLFIANLAVGLLFFSPNKWKLRFIILLLITAIVFFGVDVTSIKYQEAFKFVHLGTFFLFYLLLSVEIIKQVWQAKIVGKNVIFGLVSGYISLGLIGFFICTAIEMASPGSFAGLSYQADTGAAKPEELLYFSYITLMTIGYGEIVPLAQIARKAAVLIGLMGQMYLVVVTAIVVGKYISQLPKNQD